MRPGPPPKPTAIKRLEGNPGMHKLNDNEPKPLAGCKPPSYLTKGALLEWERSYPELERMGLITRVDQHSFGAYCTAVDQLGRAMGKLKPTKANPMPEIQVLPNGRQLPSGEEMVRRQATEEIRKFSAMFGFSPADRARIVAAPTKPVDDLNAVLSGDAAN